MLLLLLLQGWYHPMTLHGLIVVDGVVASSLADVYYARYVPNALRPYLPTIYDLIMVPLRLIYRVAGREASQALSDYLDGPRVVQALGFAHGPAFMAYWKWLPGMGSAAAGAGPKRSMLQRLLA
jgi:hypothetical protein